MQISTRLVPPPAIVLLIGLVGAGLWAGCAADVDIDTPSQAAQPEVLAAGAAATVTVPPEASPATPAAVAERTASPAHRLGHDAWDRSAGYHPRYTLEFGGVGMRVGAAEDAIAVHDVTEGLPAALAGITAGDRITAVDGMDTADMSVADFVALVRGEPGAEVALTVISEGHSPRELRLERESIVMPQTRRQYARELHHQREFGGVGIVIAQRDGELVVHSVLEGLPAEAAGLRVGDVIVEVDGESSQAMSVIDAVGRIRGLAGDAVELRVVGADGTPRLATIERDTIVVPEAGGCGR